MTEKKKIKLNVLREIRTPHILGLKMEALDPDTGEPFATENFSIPWGMVAREEHLDVLREWAITVYAKQVLKQGRVPEEKIPRKGDSIDFDISQDDIDKEFKRKGVKGRDETDTG